MALEMKLWKILSGSGIDEPLLVQVAWKNITTVQHHKGIHLQFTIWKRSLLRTTRMTTSSWTNVQFYVTEVKLLHLLQSISKRNVEGSTDPR